MKKEIVIGDKKIGQKYEPFIIAEMSGNHNQSLDRALRIVDAAAKSGAHALKLQTYTADTLTLDVNSDDFYIKDSKSLWKNQNLYKLYQKAYTPWEWHQTIFDRCKQLGLICLSTPFDETAVDFLEKLNVPCYKIASFENNHIPLLKKIAQTKKPVIMSTGLATISDLDLAVNTLKENGCKDLILLKCTSAYPSQPINANILTIPHMQTLFDCSVGLSDHTLGIGVAVASVVLGATVIEKHFTFSRSDGGVDAAFSLSDGGVDAAFSLEPDEMKNLVLETKRAWQALGQVKYGVSEGEQKSVIFKRSLYISKDLKKGDVLSSGNIRVVRPGYGLAPKYIEMIKGKKISCDVKIGTPISWDLIL
ncbi:pseudaminic acid synthase [Candidatus Dependentiae bacterium]